MLRLLRRTAAGLVVMVIGLVLLAFGLSAGAWVAVAGLVAAFVVNLLAPWPGSKRWQEWSRSRSN